MTLGLFHGHNGGRGSCHAAELVFDSLAAVATKFLLDVIASRRADTRMVLASIGDSRMLFWKAVAHSENRRDCEKVLDIGRPFTNPGIRRSVGSLFQNENGTD